MRNSRDWNVGIDTVGGVVVVEAISHPPPDSQQIDKFQRWTREQNMFTYLFVSGIRPNHSAKMCGEGEESGLCSPATDVGIVKSLRGRENRGTVRDDVVVYGGSKRGEFED